MTELIHNEYDFLGADLATDFTINLETITYRMKPNSIFDAPLHSDCRTLNQISKITCLGMAYAIQQPLQFNSNLTNAHLQAAKWVLRYL